MTENTTTKTTSDTTAAEPKNTTPAETSSEIKTETVPVTTPTTKKVDESIASTAQTTTTNDGNIPLNQVDGGASTSSPASKDASAITPDSTVMVTEADLKGVVEPESAPATDKLQEQIESLTGEIQALEAKIERLTGSAKSVSDTSAVDKEADKAPIVSTEPSPPKIETEPKVDKPADSMPEVKPEPPKATDDFFAPPTPIPSVSTKAPFSDIKTKSIQNDLPKLPETPGESSDHPQPSAMAVISEVLIVLGIVLFLLLAATSFFRDLAGEDLYQVVKSVGWLTSTITLGLGFLVAIFSKVKAAVILLGFFFLLLSAVMLVGINYPHLLGPFEDSLGTLLDFYR